MVMSVLPSNESAASESQVGNNDHIRSESPSSPSLQAPNSPANVAVISLHIKPLVPFEVAPQILTHTVPTPSVLTNDILAIADKAISNYCSVRLEHVRNLASSLKVRVISFSMCIEQ